MPRGISSDKIAVAALALLDEEGPDALSMRRVAARLGATPMALYRHFQAKEDLLTAVVALGCARVVLRVDPEGPWEVRLRSVFMSVHQGLAQHPNLLPLLSPARLATPGVMRVAEAAIEILLDAGFAVADAADAYRALLAFTLGHFADGVGARSEQEQRAIKAELVLLDPAAFPILSSAATEYPTKLDRSEEFELGLDLLIAGIRARRDAAQ